MNEQLVEEARKWTFEAQTLMAELVQKHQAGEEATEIRRLLAEAVAAFADRYARLGYRRP